MKRRLVIIPNNDFYNEYFNTNEHQSEATQEKFYVSWFDVIHWCHKMEMEMCDKRTEVDFIVAIPKGGFVPARLMSEFFGEVPIFSYGQAFEPPKRRATVVQGLNRATRVFTTPSFDGVGLVIDDICDSGKTFETIFNKHERYDFVTAALVMREGSGFHPNYVGYVHKGPEWIVFPWETDGIKRTLARGI